MRKYFILLTLVCVLLDAYFGLPNGCYDLAFWEVALPLIAGGVSAVLGYSSNRESNAANKAMTREQMAWQSQEAAINRNWQEEMYNRYQSPQSQVHQLREAGLNPALVFGQGQVGHFAGAQASSVSGHAQQPWSPEAGFNGLSQALLNRYQPSIQKEQVRSVQLQNERAAIDNLYAVDQQIADLEAKRAASRKSDSESKEIDERLEYLKSVRDIHRAKEAQDLNNAVMNEKVAQTQIEASQLAGELSVRADARAEKQLQSDLAEAGSRIALNAAMKGLTDEQKKHEIEKTAFTIVQRNKETLGLPKALNDSDYNLDKYNFRHGSGAFNRIVKFIENASRDVDEVGLLKNLPTVIVK